MASRSKSLDPALAKAFRERLAQFIRDEYKGNQSAAHRALGFSQGHLSAVLNGTKTVGLPLVVRLYDVTGVSVEEWLGLPRPEPRGTSDLATALARAVVAEMARSGISSEGEGEPELEPENGARSAPSPLPPRK